MCEAKTDRMIGIRVAAVVLMLAVGAGAGAAPYYVYLTFPGDPSTSMTVNFITDNAEGATPTVYYDTRVRDGQQGRYRHRATGATRTIHGWDGGWVVHSTDLTDLRPKETYFFTAGNAKAGYTEELKFRTLPRRGKIRFVTGGDMNATPLTMQLLKWSAEQNPMFGAVGGDIAYANGDLQNLDRWVNWLELWTTYMVTPRGHLIPLVAAIGNHETNRTDTKEYRVGAPFYWAFFHNQAAGTANFTLNLGDSAAFIALDSGHILTHEEQVPWLEAQLKATADVPFTYAIYHVPLYPSHRAYEGDYSQRGRTFWGPLFDEYGLSAGLENHDHTFKRSKPLKANKVDPDGTLYLGDGCYGVSPRTVDDELRWYLDKASSTAHFWTIETTKRRAHYTAIDNEGNVVDELTMPAK
jgi:purple acid phosphatase-like protein/calcineurin-like phosphoesterase family protein